MPDGAPRMAVIWKKNEKETQEVIVSGVCGVDFHPPSPFLETTKEKLGFAEDVFSDDAMCFVFAPFNPFPLISPVWTWLYYTIVGLNCPGLINGANFGLDLNSHNFWLSNLGCIYQKVILESPESDTIYDFVKLHKTFSLPGEPDVGSLQSKFTE